MNEPQPIPTNPELHPNENEGQPAQAQQLAEELRDIAAEGNPEQPKLLDISTPEYTQMLVEAPVFAKKGTVEARQVTVPEEVTTTLADGTQETVNTAVPGDFVITNPGGERYILKPDNFAKRYEATDEAGVYRAKGMARAFQNPTGAEIDIMAPWGEVQHGGPDCMIATTYDPENPDEVGSDRYIIGAAEFVDTYATYAEVYGTQAP